MLRDADLCRPDRCSSYYRMVLQGQSIKENQLYNKILLFIVKIMFINKTVSIIVGISILSHKILCSF